MWRDPFYYGILCSADRTSDQREHNPYYKPMITIQEFAVLEDYREANKPIATPKQLKEEYDEIIPYPRGMVIAQDKYAFTFNLPNKQRFLAKLKEAKHQYPAASLKDVVQSSQIRYKISYQKSAFYGMEVTAKEIDDAILKTFKTLKVSDQTYERYVSDMKAHMTETYDDISEQRSILTLRTNYVRKELHDYISAHMGKDRDPQEEDIYRKKRADYE